MTQSKSSGKLSLPMITGAFTLSLHTQTACELLNSIRPRKGRPFGYVPYCRQVYRLWTAAKQDDPFAEQYLIDIWEALSQAQEKLKEWHDKLLQEIKKQPVDIITQLSQSSVKQTFKPRTPYDYPAACLIKYFDGWVSLTLIAQQICLLDITQAHLLRHKAKLLVRNTLTRGNAWHHTGITRQDVFDRTEKAQEALLRFNKVDDRILHQHIRASFIKNYNITEFK